MLFNRWVFVGIPFLLLISCGTPVSDSTATSPNNSRSKEKTSPTCAKNSDPEGGFQSANLAGDKAEDILADFNRGEQTIPGSAKRGRVFDAGPRQAAHLDPLVPKLSFPLSGCSNEARAFFNQGIAQLHAFTTFESERSFRQAFALDNSCVMALWGAGLSQITFGSGNQYRGKKFAKLAFLLAPAQKLSRLEQVLIGSLNELFASSDKNNTKLFASEMLELAREFPEDELKALAALYIWNYDAMDFAHVTREEIDKLLTGVLERNPLHPAHHYRIHLWNDWEHETRALENANLIGPSSPSAGHMWHMAAHTYYPLHRPWDADLQFEAGTRADHRYAESAAEFPYVLHNYAHNASYWIQILLEEGAYAAAERVTFDAMALPFHPLYNDPESFSSTYQSPFLNASFSLVEEAFKNGLWAVIADFDSKGALPLVYEHAYLNKQLPMQMLGWVSWTYRKLGNEKKVLEFKERMVRLARGDKKATAWLTFNLRALKLLRIHLAHPTENSAQQLTLLKNPVGDFLLEKVVKVQTLAEAGDLTAIETRVRNFAEQYPANVSAGILYAQVLLKQGQTENARVAFEKVRPNAMKLDVDSPLYAAGSLLAKTFDIIGDWRAIPERAPDYKLVPPKNIGSLTPATFKFPVQDLITSGKITVVAFVLGSSCVVCNKQLAEIVELKKQWPSVDFIAVTSDDNAGPADSVVKIFADPDLHWFKSVRAYDDFDQVPLHGLFVVQNGNIIWQDRGAHAFRNWSWLQKEIGRLQVLQNLDKQFLGYENFAKDLRF